MLFGSYRFKNGPQQPESKQAVTFASLCVTFVLELNQTVQNPLHKEKSMPVKTPKELFVMILSDVRQGAEKAEKIYQEIGQLAQDAQVKEALEARAFVSGKVLATLDECFRLLGEQPAKLSGRLQETFIEDFRRESAEIQGPVARRIFVLMKLNHLANFRVGEYRALIAAATAVGHHGVSLLLETCLADKLTFMERTARLLRDVAETKAAERAAASA
jgi:ferritin-like metal-binding protein YciE